MFKPSDNNGMLYLGGVPKEIDFNRKKGKCKVISNHWGCILHKKIKEDYEITDEIVFQVGLEDIVVPFEFMKMIEYKILKKYFEKGLAFIWI